MLNQQKIRLRTIINSLKKASSAVVQRKQKHLFNNKAPLSTDVSNTSINKANPVAIGAIGGSGTRVVASILEDVGFHMGSNLNGAHDNLEFTRRFKKLEVLELSDAKFNALVDTFADQLALDARASASIGWGWKEPNTHIVAERILNYLPELRYVHILRNGLDMAHSENQNQPRLWGEKLLKIAAPKQVTPRYALKYWCSVHRRITAMSQLPAFAGRILFLDFDQLCLSPTQELQKLFDFLGLTLSEKMQEALVRKIAPPSSIGRWRKFGLDIFDQEDVDYIKSLNLYL